MVGQNGKLVGQLPHQLYKKFHPWFRASLSNVSRLVTLSFFFKRVKVFSVLLTRMSGELWAPWPPTVPAPMLRLLERNVSLATSWNAVVQAQR